MNSKLQRIMFLIVFIISLLLPSSANAQTGASIRINMYTKLERDDSMLFKIYFTFFDERNGVPITAAEPQSAHLTFLNTKLESDADVKKPDIPIYITLVLDGSGSMAGMVQDTKNAAIQALNNIPDKALFSVIKFDEAIYQLQDFVENVNTVKFTITERYKVEGNKGTCLYDAAYSAVEALVKAPVGRRALILFTDGMDEKTSGAGQCSKHTYEELVNLAYKSQVPINTIGLNTGKLNAVELKNMATSTGGYAAIGAKGDLSGMFKQVMDALRSQWMVEVDAYPKRGQQDVVLKIDLKNVGSMSTTVTFTADKDYNGPPSPVTAKVARFNFTEDSKTATIQLAITSPQLAKKLSVSLWDSKTNSLMKETTFTTIPADGVFSISSPNIQDGGDYVIKINIFDKNDKAYNITIGENKNPTETLTHEFKVTLKQVKLSVLSIQALKNDAVVKLSVLNGENIAKYEGWLVIDGTTNQVPNSGFTETALSPDGTIVVKLDERKIPEGKYTLVMLAKDKDNQILSQTDLKGFVYTPYVKSIFETIFEVVKANPIILLPVVLVVMLVVGFLMFTALREKSMTGTPAMQGSMGKMKGGGFALPVNMAEPPPPPPTPSRAAAPPSLHPVQSKPAPPPRPAPQSYPSQGTVMAGTPSRPGETTFINQGESRTEMYPGLGGQASTMAIGSAKLVVDSPGDPSVNGKTFFPTTYPYLIGREDGCNLTIKDNSMSRQHAQITYVASSNTYYIADLRSSNGTRVGGVPLSPNAPAPITNGSMIQLGSNTRIILDLS